MAATPPWKTSASQSSPAASRASSGRTARASRRCSRLCSACPGPGAGGGWLTAGGGGPVAGARVVLMGRYGRIGLVRQPGRRDRETAMAALERVRLADRAGRMIGELSGGEQRRALIARVLAQEADLLLLDEPLAGLDAAAQHDLLRLFEELRREGKTPLVGGP